MRVLLAPDSFKGSIGAAQAAAALAQGWLAGRPGDEVTCLPLADGGEGTLEVVAAAAGPEARWRQARVSGPGSETVDCPWLELPDGTAVVELARCAGLPLLAAPDPLGAHTAGLGEVVGHALDAGAHAVIIGLGGSASTDGGSGALAALGARFLDEGGRPLPLGGGALAGLASVDTSALRPLPAGGVTCLVDVRAPLLGPHGAAAVFGPQKGAGPVEVARLEAGLARLASLLGGDPGAAGAGAAGGTGYGLAAGLGAALAPGAPELCRLTGLDRRLAEADLVVTGEGRFDATSLDGKVTGTVIAAAAAANVPCALVAGRVAGQPPVPAVVLADLAGSPAPALADPRRWLLVAGRHLATGLAQTIRADAL
ncbi:MAG TPA: glycerate kinase [Streptosporangiaceae bacterium]|nr:glycerate kinase [Streptosporangiaceae bacterium]